MTDRSFEIGPIRPPSEARSLLLQVTRGCTWNKCKFCVVYRHQHFSVLKPEEIRRNIDNMAYFRDLIADCTDGSSRLDKSRLYSRLETLNENELQCFYMVYTWLASGGKNVFLQDGNSVALKPEKLADALYYLREKFPHIERITTYGRAETLSHWSVDQFKLLRDSGLNRIHTGFESGSDRVLTLVDKGLTQAQEIDGGRKVKEAGIELSLYFMPGIGGLELSAENASETALVVNAINPDFVRLRTFVMKHESELFQLERDGLYQECSDIGKLREIRSLVEGIDAPDTQLVSDHIVNLIGGLNGHIASEKQSMLNQIDRVLELPREEQRTYQLARRYGLVEDYPQLYRLPGPQLERIKSTVAGFTDRSEEDWENHLNAILRQYV